MAKHSQQKNSESNLIITKRIWHFRTVTGIVTMPGQHRQFSRRRPLPHQCPPRRMGGALHQFEARRTGSNQPCIEFAHLCGAIQRVG